MVNKLIVGKIGEGMSFATKLSIVRNLQYNKRAFLLDTKTELSWPKNVLKNK